MNIPKTLTLRLKKDIIRNIKNTKDLDYEKRR